MKLNRMRALAALATAGMAATLMSVVPATALADPYVDALIADFPTKNGLPAVYPGHYPEWARIADRDTGGERSGLVAIYFTRQQTAEFAAGRGVLPPLVSAAAGAGLLENDPTPILRQFAGMQMSGCLALVFTPGRTAPVGNVAEIVVLPAGYCPGD